MKHFYALILLFFSTFIFSQEICNNGIDDDGDTKIDLNDDECQCNTASITSIIPNPSFETYNGCPSSFSELYVATPWIQATTATTDYYNKNCSFIAQSIPANGLTNYPDGNGIVAALFLRDWNEYLGATLQSPMVKGEAYQLSIKIAALTIKNDGSPTSTPMSNFEPVNITIYGCNNGTNLPLNTVYSPNVADATWIEIGHALYTPTSTWGELSIIFTSPIDVNAIMIGAPPVLPNSYPTIYSSSDYPYFLFDNLLLNKSSSFGVNITQNGSYCDNNLSLHANITTNVSPSVTYQWYHNGIAIVGATSSTYDIASFSSNLGNYTVKITDGANCFISSAITITNNISSPNCITTQPSCISATGSITVTTAAAEYSFDNGVTWQTSPTKSSLPVGTYFVKTKTPNNCISTATGINIVPPQMLQNGNVSVSHPATCGEKGSITINSSFAAEYSFDGGITWTTNNVANNLAPGTYSIKIKNSLGCQSAAQFVTIYEVLLPPPTCTIVQPTCEAKGSISVTTVADEYSFDNGVTWSTDPNAVNLPPGIYLVMIRNSNGCQSSSAYIYLYTPYLETPVTYTAVQPQCGKGGEITITSPANEYSFDGGSTWTTNNTAYNLPPGSHLILIRNNINCASTPKYVYLNSFYLPEPTYSVKQPECGIGGEITITSPASEYSFDGGYTWTTNPVATNLQSGTYYIKVKNNLGCTSNYSYVNLNFVQLANPDYTISNPICGNNGSITIVTTAAEYSFDGGYTWTTNPVATNLSEGYHFIKIRNATNCESNYLSVYLSDFNHLYPKYTIDNAGCNKYATLTITSLADYYSFDDGLTWSTNNTLTNLSGGENIAIKLKMNNNCMSYTTYAYISSYFRPLPVVTDFDTLICDNLNDGTEPVNLTLYHSKFITNPNNYSFSFYKTLRGAQALDSNEYISNSSAYNLNVRNKTLYVVVKDIYGCTSIAKLNLELIDTPVPSIKDLYYLCENFTVDLSETKLFDSYLWSTGETTPKIVVAKPGIYTLTVTETHGNVICSTTKSINVILSNPAIITSFETDDWTNYDNVITVNVTGLGDYEYSLDGFTYQDSNVFSDLALGEYTVHVRDKHGCGISRDDTYLLMYPKFFTPNNDGFNDFWRIKLSENEPNLIVKIFDRYDRFIHQFDSNYKGWDGNYNGKPAVADDYWFVVTRQNGKQHKGHFTLKR